MFTQGEIGNRMYKIREVAKLLNVETVDIHKKLISLKAELRGHVTKINGITQIDDKGIEIISRGFILPDELDEKAELGTAVNPNGNDKSAGSENSEYSSLIEQDDTVVYDNISNHDLLNKNKVEDFKEVYDSNAIKSEINKVDLQIYKISNMLTEYTLQLREKEETILQMIRN